MRWSSHEPQAIISLVKCCSPIPQLPYSPRRRIAFLIISKIIIISASREFEIFLRENLRWLTNPRSHWLKNVKEWCLQLKNAWFHVILLLYNEIILFKSIFIILRIIHNFYKSLDFLLSLLIKSSWLFVSTVGNAYYRVCSQSIRNNNASSIQSVVWSCFSAIKKIYSSYLNRTFDFRCL